MMWITKYVGQRWTQEHDCGYWFRKIQKEQFGRDVPPICNVPDNPRVFAANACRIVKILKEKPDVHGWRQTDIPKNGDAVLLALRTRPHHIGVVIFVDGLLCVLHAVEQNGVVISTKSVLRQNHFRIDSYWTYGN